MICAILAFLVYFSIRSAIAQRAFLSAKNIMQEEPVVSRETIAEYGAALTIMEKAVRLNRRDSSYHRGLGDIYLRYLPYVIKLDMAGGEASVDIGERKLNAPQILMVAKDEFLRAEELEPTVPISHLRVASINQFLSSSFQGEGLASEARSEFLKAQSLYPASPFYNYVAGLFLLECGETGESLPYFQKAMRGDSQMAYDIIVALGDSGMKADDIKKILPRDARAYLDFAVYLLEEENPEGADAAYGEAMAIRPFDEGETDHYISVLIRMRQFDRAIKILNEIIEKNPGDERSYAKLGDAYMGLRGWQKAYESYGMALKNCPWTSALKRRRSLYFSKRGWTLIYQEQFVKAIEDMTDAQNSDPSNAEAYFGEALCYINLNTDLEKAEEKLEKAIALNPDSNRYYYNLAEVEDALGKYDKAVDFWKVSISREPGKPELHLSLAEAYLKKGKLEDAKKQSAMALELSPRNSRIRKRALEIIGVD